MFCFQIGPLTSVGRHRDQDHLRRHPQGRRRQQLREAQRHRSTKIKIM